MFFLVRLTWESEKGDEVSDDLKKMMVQAFYRQIGNPWPKLFYFWKEKDNNAATSLWESSTFNDLENLFKENPLYQASYQRVFQLFPPYVDGYSMMSVK